MCGIVECFLVILHQGETARYTRVREGDVEAEDRRAQHELFRVTFEEDGVRTPSGDLELWMTACPRESGGRRVWTQSESHAQLLVWLWDSRRPVSDPHGGM